MRFDRMLVTTDLTKVSRAACVYASEMAVRLGVPATFLHVDELVPPTFEDVEEYDAYTAFADDARRNGLATLRTDLAERGLPEPHLVVIRGHAAEATVDYAREHGFDLIVAARRSRVTLEERLLGSTTRKLLRDATVPVLVIPSDVESLPSLAHGHEPGPVLAPTDLHDISALGARVANEVAGALGAQLIVVHVVDWPSVTDLMISAPNDLLTRVARRIKLRAVDALNEHLTAVGLGDREQRVINGPSPAEALSAMADHVAASLVILPATTKGALKRFFLGSTSTRLIKLVARPVLVMPETWLSGGAS
ncbi:MAG: universal stress protein [Deltaproteobacteria bacterium]|nr:MAG: universal stress protein [Deltaproteobacteria bacterium]